MEPTGACGRRADRDLKWSVCLPLAGPVMKAWGVADRRAGDDADWAATTKPELAETRHADRDETPCSRRAKGMGGAAGADRLPGQHHGEAYPRRCAGGFRQDHARGTVAIQRHGRRAVLLGL